MIKKAPDHPDRLFRLSKTSLAQIVLIAVALGILVPQFKQFQNSWSHLESVSPLWLLSALSMMTLTIVFASLVYISLVPSRLPFMRTALAQLATYFTNRLLPSGLGGIGFNALYLTKQARLSRTDSAVYATANNIVGFIAFSICVIFSIIFGDTTFTFPTIAIELPYIIAGLVFIALLLVVLFYTKIISKLYKLSGHLVSVILTIIRHPARVAFATLSSIGITICYVAVLWFSLHSVDISISLVDLFIAFIAGNVALTISPTPGGIGAVEASITALLVSLGNDTSQALAGVVVFRIVSYWIPILPGFIAFRYMLKKHYV